MRNADESDRVRIDKWLWAARFYKTRSLATDAVAGGKVAVNGERAKPAKAIKPGDEIRLRLGPQEYIVVVTALAERRGSAAVAHTLYEETEPSRLARERLSAQLKLAPAAFQFDEKGRPSKKDRRDLSKFIGRRRP
jgi:ribosome-associated heat shock protein Hsp15